jgi:serine/threonine protein kinase
VSDFGFAVVKKADDKRKDPRPLGTPLYMAPEVMEGKAYNGFKADVFAFGTF